MSKLNSTKVFTKDNLLFVYASDCTFFTKKEIIKLHSRFRELNPDVVPMNMQTDEAMTAALPPEDVVKMTELKENPFANRILEVFSEDASGHVTFNNFVDMFNVFSEHAPRDLKAYYAFKIYDMGKRLSMYFISAKRAGN